MKNYLLLACLALCFISCSSDDDNTIPEPEENFFALTIGNSWVYELYQRENQATAIYSPTGVIDSVEIVATEMIDGYEFYKYRIRRSGNDSNNPIHGQNGERFNYFRDSLGYLVSHDGKMVFSREDDQEFFLYDGPVYPVYTKRGENTEIITAEAGEFDCGYMEIYARMEPGGELLPALDKIHYAEGIGEVRRTISFASSSIPVIERRLISYSIE